MKVLCAGSVDGGKSTLLGRLLLDTGHLPDDVQARLQDLKPSANGAGFDLALALDGLLDEQAQGITTDVAWRTLRLEGQTVLLADCPGHVQYTRNMVSAAMQCDAAVILVDATRGVCTQTRRHLLVCSRMGIARVFVAVNKIDELAAPQVRFDEVCAQMAVLLARLPTPLGEVCFAPTSGQRGVNVTTLSAQTPWYAGRSLCQWLLQGLQQAAAPARAPWFAMPVQRQTRPFSTWRGYDGTVLAGAVSVGQAVRALPSGQVSTVATIRGLGGMTPMASAGQAASLMLADELDLPRGEVLVDDLAPVVTTEIVQAFLIWLSPAPASPGARHLFQLGCASTFAMVSRILALTDIETLEERPCELLTANVIARVEVMLEQPIALARYAESRELGGFMLVDPLTHETLAAGGVIHPMPRQIFWQHTVVDKAQRARLLKQKPMVIWLTGLSGAGKSTIANAVESALHRQGHATYLLDGDHLRHGLCRDLGFSVADRAENLRRVGEVARMMVDAGLLVLASFISPSAREREAVAARFGADEYAEVYVSTPLPVCEARDPKGLYKLARAGALAEFTGVSSPYDAPTAPALLLDTAQLSVEECVRRVVALVASR